MTRITLATLQTLAASVNKITETPWNYEDAFKVDAYHSEFDGKKYYRVTIFNGESVVKNGMTAKECAMFLQGMAAMAEHSVI